MPPSPSRASFVTNVSVNSDILIAADGRATLFVPLRCRPDTETQAEVRIEGLTSSFDIPCSIFCGSLPPRVRGQPGAFLISWLYLAFSGRR